jgi:hypothetical protein
MCSVCVCGTARCNSWLRHLKAWVKGNHTLSKHVEWKLWNLHPIDYRITFAGIVKFPLIFKEIWKHALSWINYYLLPAFVCKSFWVLRARIIKGYGNAMPSHGTKFIHVFMEHNQIFNFFNRITSTLRHKDGGLLTIFFPSQ